MFFVCFFFCLIIRRPPVFTRTDPLFPYTPLFLSLPPVSDTFPGFEVVAWNALMCPACMPKDIVDRLAREVDAILLEKDTQASFFDNGLTVMPSNSDRKSTRLNSSH